MVEQATRTLRKSSSRAASFVLVLCIILAIVGEFAAVASAGAGSLGLDQLTYTLSDDNTGKAKELSVNGVATVDGTGDSVKNAKAEISVLYAGTKKSEKLGGEYSLNSGSWSDGTIPFKVTVDKPELKGEISRLDVKLSLDRKDDDEKLVAVGTALPSSFTPVDSSAIVPSPTASTNKASKSSESSPPTTGTLAGTLAATTTPSVTEEPVLQTLATATTASIAVDGALEPIYASTGFSNLTYTRDQGGTFTGILSVIETTDAYYIGFQQALNAKSNAYCVDKKLAIGCFQTFKHLVSSDYMSLSWNIDGRNIVVPVDILRATTSAPSGYSGDAGAGDGGPIQGISPSAVTGKSAMDYNLNVAGWRDFNNSPNFAGQPLFPYIYPATIEVRLDKAAGGLVSGLDLTNGTFIVHNSPESSTIGEPHKAIGIGCPTGKVEGALGSTVSLQVLTTLNGVPKAAQNVLAVITGVGQVVSVGGTSGTRGVTGIDGIANIVVTSNEAGTTNVRAVWDLNNNGVWDQATEPSTEPTCPVTWKSNGTPEYSFTIVKTVNRTTADFGDTLNYEVVVTNTGDTVLTNVLVTDPIPVGTTYVAGSASGNGSYDEGANKLSWVFDSLGAHSAVRMTFSVVIQSGAPTTIPNVATACPNELACKDSGVTTRILSVLGEKIRAQAEQLPRTGAEDIALALMALGLIGAGFNFNTRRMDRRSNPLSS